MSLKEVSDNLEKVSKFENYFKNTPFDQYDLTVNPDLIGRQVIMRGSQIAEAYQEISHKWAKYKYALSIAKIRTKEATGKAQREALKKEPKNAKERDEVMLSVSIKLDGDSDETTLQKELLNQSSLEFLVNLGESKIKLADKMCDFIRSILSFSKTEGKVGSY